MTAPVRTEEMRAALKRQGEELAATLEELPLEEFFAPQGTFWSPAEHLRHLIKSVRPLARALRIPKALLLLRFGPSLQGSRPPEVVRDRYLELLAAGGKAGPFGPSSRVPDLSPEDWRREIFKSWRKVMAALHEATASWGEVALDRLRLPHPLIGKLTVREMLLWTHYHNHHHLSRIQERR